MFKMNYFTKQLLEFISSEIDRRHVNKVVWLGYNPGFPAVYDMLLDKGIEIIKVFDNGRNKHGWVVKPSKDIYKDHELKIEPVNVTDDIKDALYLCANAYYREFELQLAHSGILKNQILDIYKILQNWMHNEEDSVIKDYKLIIGRELQLEEIKILKWFKEFCHDNNLRWFIAEGTLLGAVRHKGFIPWDDDIDVFMPYEDYIKAISLFPKHDSYTLLDWRTEDKYPFQYAKVVRDDTYLLHPLTTFGYCILGCCIDIFPIAGYPESKEEIDKKLERHTVLDREWRYSIVMRDLYGEAFPDARPMITNEKYKLPFYESKLVGTMQKIAGNAWAISREAFDEVVYLDFEDDKYPAPKGYDEFLTARYGDYMTPPPAEQRRIHSFPTYIIQ